MNYRTIEERALRKISARLHYQYCYYTEFDFTILNETLSRKKNGVKSDIRYSEVYIMFDTETSKEHEVIYDHEGKAIPQRNHICCWSLSIRAFHTNICTLRGAKPSELVHCFKLIRENITADVVYLFAHNLSYDWTFLRRFLMKEFDKPKSQLNIRPHVPLTIQFKNNLILRDSLILAGVSLDTWGKNLSIEHKKANGNWNYNVIRNQADMINFTDEELTYIEHDTLAGVECLNKLADNLGDTLVSLPFTATGIVRRRIRKEGKKKYAKQLFNKQKITFEEYKILEKVFHGGFTHANRGVIDWIRKDVTAYDFKSSYPYCLLTMRAPCEEFYHLEGTLEPEYIINDTGRSYVFKYIARNITLRDKFYPMPALQFYKCDYSINAICDNGRILQADYVEIYLTEIDLKLINKIYECEWSVCTDIMTALNDYLPRWYRDEVFKIFKEKCEIEYQIKVLKEGDMSLYNLKKAQLNALYGMAVTSAIKQDIVECYDDDPEHENGEYYPGEKDLENEFNKYLKKQQNILPYVFGVYCTATAMYNLFELAEQCIDGINRNWLYSDTDSIYSTNWNEEKVKEYNKRVKQRLIDAGYGSVIINEKEYTLGVADLDNANIERFRTQGAKRYAYEKNHKIKITVAGVPKKAGACCLRSLEDFHEGFVFYGQGTGKTTHSYIYGEIEVDQYGNEVADSIDLNDADYTLSSVDTSKFQPFIDDLFTEEIAIDFYEDI